MVQMRVADEEGIPARRGRQEGGVGKGGGRAFAAGVEPGIEHDVGFVEFEKVGVSARISLALVKLVKCTAIRSRGRGLRPVFGKSFCGKCAGVRASRRAKGRSS